MVGIRDYSTTADSNLSVGGISIAEGWARASVNNALRAGYSDLANLLLDHGGGATTTGSANTYLLDLPTAPTAYADNLLFVCKLHATVTGASTININGLGVKAFKKLVNGVATDLNDGDGPAGHRPVCVYSSADNCVLMLLAAPTFTHTGGETWPITERMKEQVYLLDFIPVEHHAAIRDGTAATVGHANFYDCSDAMDAAMAAISVPYEVVTTLYVGGPEIIFPYGHCYFSRTIEMKKTMILTGYGSGGPAGYSTQLHFAAGITGITVNYLTSFEGDVVPGTSSANGSVIRHLALRSNSNGTPDPDWDSNYTTKAADHGVGHGIWARAQCAIEHCRIQYFPVHGIYVQAASSGIAIGQPWIYGNANLMYVAYCALYSNGYDGIYIDGPDTNAGTFIALNVNDNLHSGVRDSCLINNTHIGHHADQNCKAGLCSYAADSDPGTQSRRYLCLDDTRATTIPPAGHADSEDVWAFWMNSPVNPDTATDTPPWPYTAIGSGITKDYKTCFPYYFDQVSSGCVIVGQYTEASMPSWFTTNTIVIGHANSVNTLNSQPTVIAPGGVLAGHLHYDSNYTSANEFSTHFNRTFDESITWIADGDNTAGLSFLFNDADKTWAFQHSRNPSAIPIRFTVDNLNAITGGRSAPLDGGSVIFGQGLFLGDNTTNARLLSASTIPPPSQEHAAGEIYLNSAPAAGEPWGWRCIATGTPGTWQPLRDTGSQQSISDVAFTLTPGSSPYHTRHTGSMTANRAVTLSTTGAMAGLNYRITRTSGNTGGPWSLNVGTGPLKALAAGEWCEVTYDGSAYYLSAFGSL